MERSKDKVNLMPTLKALDRKVLKLISLISISSPNYVTHLSYEALV